MPWDNPEHWDGRWWLNTATGFVGVRDEMWDYARSINYVDAGEAVEMVWNNNEKDWEVK